MKNAISHIYSLSTHNSHDQIFNILLTYAPICIPFSSNKSLKFQLNSTQVAHNVIQYFSFEYAQKKKKFKFSSNYELSLVESCVVGLLKNFIFNPWHRTLVKKIRKNQHIKKNPQRKIAISDNWLLFLFSQCTFPCIRAVTQVPLDIYVSESHSHKTCL